MSEIKSNVIVSSLSGYVVYYGWRQDNPHDLVLDLGSMKRAVVIRKSIANYWFISESSFFPFSKVIYSKKFNTIEDAKSVANSIVLEWLNDTYSALKLVAYQL